MVVEFKYVGHNREYKILGEVYVHQWLQRVGDDYYYSYVRGMYSESL